MRKLLCLILLGLSSSGQAHEWDDEGPWNAFEDWRVIDASAEDAIFLSNSLRSRAGSALTFETLVVRSKADQYGSDQYNEHFLVDCDTSDYLSTHLQGFQPNGKGSPPVLRMNRAGESGVGRAPSGSVMERVIDTACDKVPFPAEKIEDPHAWARRLFSGSSEKAKP